MDVSILKRKPTAEFQLDVDQLRKAISALLEYIATRKQQSTNLLEDSAEWINLFVRYKSTSTMFRKYPVQLELPKGVWNSEEFRICLIMSDNKKEKRVRKAEELLVPHEVMKVWSAQEIRKQFHDEELRRELCNSYDLFLLENVLKDAADDFLGGRFVRLKKFPSLVKLTKSAGRWVDAVKTAKMMTQMYCYVQPERSIKVGRSSFTVEEISKNVQSVVKQMMEKQGDHGWEDILQIFLCTGESLKLPIYQTFPDAPIVELDRNEEKEEEAKQKKRLSKRKLKSNRPTHELKKALVSVLNETKESSTTGN